MSVNTETDTERGSGGFTVAETETTYTDINPPFMVFRCDSNQEQEPEANKVSGLSYMTSALLATIIEDAITSASILSECNNSLRVLKVMAKLPSLQTKKYGIKPIEVKDGIHHPVTSDENKLRKLMSDKQIFIDLLKELYKGLCKSEGIKGFTELLAKKNLASKRSHVLQEEVNRNKAKFKELKKQLRMQRNTQKSAVYEFEGNVDALRAKIEDTEQIGVYQTVYQIKWQRSRKEQYAYTLSEIQKQNIESIKDYKNKLLHENRVHNEVELWTNVFINEKMSEIENMMEKYETDNEAMDLRVRIMKSDYTKMLDTRIGKEKHMEKRDEEMKAWIKYKEDREAVRLYKEKMQQSAIIVQAWWRGILQRHQLGPFRPKRGKKKRTIIFSTVPE